MEATSSVYRAGFLYLLVLSVDWTRSRLQQVALPWARRLQEGPMSKPTPEQKRVYDRKHYLRAVEHWRFYTFRIPQDDYDELQVAAKWEGVSVPELIRTFITWGLEEHDPIRNHCKAHRGTQSHRPGLQREGR